MKREYKEGKEARENFEKLASEPSRSHPIRPAYLISASKKQDKIADSVFSRYNNDWHRIMPRIAILELGIEKENRCVRREGLKSGLYAQAH
jgi:hypothetical protein